MITSSQEIEVGDKLAPTQHTSYQRSLVEMQFKERSIHRDDYTQTQGYAGALTSSYVLCGYMSEIMVNTFGPAYIKGGKIYIKFFGGGVQNGDQITIKGVVTEKCQEENGVRVVCDLRMEKGQGHQVVAGQASVLLAK